MIEITLGIGIALRQVRPRISGIASLVSVGMFLTTLTFLFTTPGWEPTLGFPGLSSLPGQFLLKDIVLLGAVVFTAGEAFAAVPGRETSRTHHKRDVSQALASWPFAYCAVMATVH